MLFGRVLLNPNTRKNMTDLKETSLWDFFFFTFVEGPRIGKPVKKNSVGVEALKQLEVPKI